MQPKDVVPFICTFLLGSVLYAVPIPVTGDSSAVWTAIDISPTDDKMQNVAITAEESFSSDTASLQETTGNPAPSAWDPPEEKPVAVQKKKAASPQQTTPTQPAESRPAATEDVMVATDSAAQSAPDTTPAIVPGTLVVTSIPDSARITINDVSVGSTPYNVYGFYPGVYDVSVAAPGFMPYSKSIELKPGGTGFVTANLIPESGRLFIASSPANATVSINDTVVGMTPYTSGAMNPGIYELAIELPGFVTYSEQLGVSSNLTDTLQIALQPEKKPGIFAAMDFKNSRSIRRITFGAVTISATAAGFILNSLASKNLEKENAALQEYREARLSEAEYTRRYDSYHNLTKTTNRYAVFRDICYGLGVAGGVGFTVSIFY